MDCAKSAVGNCFTSDKKPAEEKLPRSTNVFGVELAALCLAEQKSIPTIVIKCIETIESRDGLRWEGIYRKSGNLLQIRDLISKFNNSPTYGQDLDLMSSNSYYHDLDVISGVLKQYLRELPIPLTTFDLYPRLIEWKSKCILA